MSLDDRKLSLCTTRAIVVLVKRFRLEDATRVASRRYPRGHWHTSLVLVSKSHRVPKECYSSGSCHYLLIGCCNCFPDVGNCTSYAGARSQSRSMRHYGTGASVRPARKVLRASYRYCKWASAHRTIISLALGRYYECQLSAPYLCPPLPTALTSRAGAHD